MRLEYHGGGGLQRNTLLNLTTQPYRVRSAEPEDIKDRRAKIRVSQDVSDRQADRAPAEIRAHERRQLAKKDRPQAALKVKGGC
jgi:hypothetical protein